MRKLVLFDVDSTLINEEVIDLLALKAGKGQQVAEITEAAMAGKLDFAQSLKARVALLKGLPETVIGEVKSEITLTNGALETIRELKALGHIPAVVSGGFTVVIEELLTRLGISEFRANNLGICDGRLTGEVEGLIIDRITKANTLVEFAARHQIPLEDTIAVGDGANDIEMIKRAGLGIAFCAKPALVEVADVSITTRDLREVLKFL